jgi:hypothetical protein
MVTRGAGLAAGGLMPVDPVVTLVVLLQGAMPTAQNLVVLLNLDAKVRPAASLLPHACLRQNFPAPSSQMHPACPAVQPCTHMHTDELCVVRAVGCHMLLGSSLSLACVWRACRPRRARRGWRSCCCGCTPSPSCPSRCGSRCSCCSCRCRWSRCDSSSLATEAVAAAIIHSLLLHTLCDGLDMGCRRMAFQVRYDCSCQPPEEDAAPSTFTQSDMIVTRLDSQVT